MRPHQYTRSEQKELGLDGRILLNKGTSPPPPNSTSCPHYSRQTGSRAFPAVLDVAESDYERNNGGWPSGFRVMTGSPPSPPKIVSPRRSTHPIHTKIKLYSLLVISTGFRVQKRSQDDRIWSTKVRLVLAFSKNFPAIANGFVQL